MENIHLVKEATSSAVGNGRRTMFWSHPWALDKPLEQMVITDIPLELQDASVEEMWEPSTGWKWDIFAAYLPNIVLQTIASFEVQQGDDSPDSYFWNVSSSGNFTLKSTMEMIRNDVSASVNVNWSLPWKVPAPQKIRLFLWLVLHDRTLSNSNRFKRGLTEDARCVSCGVLEETTLHILRDCPKAKVVWQSIHSGLLNSRYFSLPLEEWIIHGISHETCLTIENWSTLFALTVWWIWRWRNCRVFGRDGDIPESPFLFLLKRQDETLSALSRNDNLFRQHTTRSKEVFVRWSPPPSDWFVLNIDGASRGNPGESGAGGLIRTADGSLIRAFALKLGIGSSMRAEVMALVRGLALAKELDLPRLIIQSDSQIVVELMKGNETMLSRPYVIKNCKELIECHQWRVEMQHIYREANTCADWLANLAIDQDELLTCFENPPPCLSYLMHQDICGVAWPRMVASPPR
ncbi:hypothetical protein vseg_000390 [Gypsophila vaccaria]